MNPKTERGLHPKSKQKKTLKLGGDTGVKKETTLTIK